MAYLCTSDITAELAAVRSLIAAGWCQGSEACGPGFEPCGYYDPDAERFCMVGALARATRDRRIRDTGDRSLTLIPDELMQRTRFALRAALRHTFPDRAADGLEGFNDDAETRLEHVLAVIDAAGADPWADPFRDTEGL